MKVNKRQHYNETYLTGYPWLMAALLLCACSQNGVESEAGKAPAQAAALPDAGSSQSAAQLANDASFSIQSALAVAEGTEPAFIPTVSQGMQQARAQSETEVDNEVTDEVTGSSDGQEQVTDNADSGSENEATDEVTDNSNAQEQVTDSGDSGTTDIAAPADTEVTRFASDTTAGFTGEVLEASIKLQWQPDPNARGYNIYRQGEYINTVFDTEFIDNDVYDESYYYEIQAFDFDENFYYVATGLTVRASTLERVNPNAPAANSQLLDEFELVFSDEFNGSTLDTSKWNTSFLWGPGLFINSEEQYYVDVVRDPDFGYNPFTFDGEHMTINSIRTPEELKDKALHQPYLSGLITSYDSFKFTYGYVETRARFTHGRGYWPAFWLLNAYYVDAKPEIDIMEFIGDNQDVVYHTYHYFDNDGNLRSTESMPTTGIDFTSGFHTFGVDWRPGTLVFYVDGIERHRVNDINVSSQEMYVLANTAIGGWWAGSPDETTPFPGEYMLDYIRVYQKRTPYDEVILDDGQTSIPLADDIPGKRSPNHRPPKELWPEGYPDGT